MIDPKSAVILLDCLKLNDKYRALFEKHRAGLVAWHRFLGEYDTRREADPEQAKAWWREHLPKAEKALHPEPFWPLVNRKHLGIEGFARAPFSVVDADRKRVLNAEEGLAFIDPKKKIDKIDEAKRKIVLSQIFDRPGVLLLPLEEKYDPDCDRLRYTLRLPDTAHSCGPWGNAPDNPALGLQPNERVFVIDLRKKRKQLKKEFSEFLEREGENPYKKDRDRDIALRGQQLEVFRKRRMKIPFENIAAGMGIPVSTAKEYFYRAYELTQGTPYPRKRTTEPYQRERTVGRQPEMSREQVQEVVANHFLGGPEETE